MNDSAFQRESGGESIGDGAPPHDDAPRFGALDIVEAFTAMRHEWRGQTKESRALAEQIQAAVASFQALESKLLAGVANIRVTDNGSQDAAEARPLVSLIVDTDHQLSRAVASIAQWET